MVSCAGKVEWRYSSSQVTAFTILSRQSKGHVKVYGKGDEELECWISHKIILRKPDAPDGDMPIDVNDDGNARYADGRGQKEVELIALLFCRARRRIDYTVQAA